MALLWHASDLSVKPIILNNTIEAIQPARYDPAALPFEAPRGTATFFDLDEREQLSILHAMQRCLQHHAEPHPPHEILNVLGFAETAFATHGQGSNFLLATPLAPLMVALLHRPHASPALCCRVATLFALLTRYATGVPEALWAGAQGLLEGLASLVEAKPKPKHEKVRRRGVAALGELLFCIAMEAIRVRVRVGASVPHRDGGMPAPRALAPPRAPSLRRNARPRRQPQREVRSAPPR